MADRDWDRKTFFSYKANPWVNRQSSPIGDSTPAAGDVSVQHSTVHGDVAHSITKVSIGNDTTTKQQASELAAFRTKITDAANSWERLVDDANKLASMGKSEDGAAAFMKSAEFLNEIVATYRINRHLFSPSAITEIDAMLSSAEGGGDNSFTELIRAIQRINSASEEAYSTLVTQQSGQEA